MLTSDWIQIISIISTSILSVSAIIISVLTLKQNSKMIEESTRPYITIFPKTTNFTSIIPYLIIKNFGQSSGKIISFNCNQNLSNFATYEPFKNLVGTTLTPGQSLSTAFLKGNICNELLEFTITYKYGNKTYVETISIDFKQFKGLCCAKNHSSNDLKEISDILQEMTIQNLLK